jgi:hypothetical protein
LLFAIYNNDTPVELYDLFKDIGESRNVANQYPQLAEEMLEIMKKAHKKSEQAYARFAFEK